MPANLPPQYHEAEARFKEATTPADKVAALQEMLRIIPKHKGTEKLQADLKKRLSKQRKQAQQKPAGSTQRPFHHVEREGIGQVVLAGPPNSGKSLLMARLTHAQPEVADYPFATRAPLPGMMQFEDVQIQLVDTPPLAREILEPWQLGMLEQTDTVLLVFDVTDPLLLEQTEYVLEILADRRVDLKGRGRGRPVIALGNKTDLPGGPASFKAWQDLFRRFFKTRPFSAFSQEDLDWLPGRLFESLGLIRIYTKKPGQQPEKDGSPYILKRGATAIEAAQRVHKDLAQRLQFARVWGSVPYPGQKVDRHHPLEDGDIIEIHA